MEFPKVEGLKANPLGEILSLVNDDRHLAAGLTERAEEARRRTRVLDDHMFTIGLGKDSLVTFRLQLFEGPGLRPVAIVTQDFNEGPSVTNVAEACAAVVWRQRFPHSKEPPIWITCYSADESWPVRRVEFVSDGLFSLTEPAWDVITREELEVLIGQGIDLTRGNAYVPRTVPAEPETYFEVMEVAAFPKTRPFRAGCMKGAKPRRLLRRFLPRRWRTCCWYHGGDWHEVSSVAIDLLVQAQDHGLSGDELRQAVLRLGQNRLTGRWQKAAFHSLLTDPIVVVRGDDGLLHYVNGQHRAQAMKDAGVSRTLVEGCRWPDPSESATRMRKKTSPML